MAEFQQDPSANTGRFRAFVEQANNTDSKSSPTVSRGRLIGVGVALAVIIVVILAVAL